MRSLKPQVRAYWRCSSGRLFFGLSCIVQDRAFLLLIH